MLSLSALLKVSEGWCSALGPLALLWAPRQARRCACLVQQVVVLLHGHLHRQHTHPGRQETFLL